jgi:serine protease
VVGVAPEAEIFSVKVFADNGMFAYSSGILSAAMACAENGADIISMSLGGPLPSPFELFGFRQLLNSNGIISVAAAGNSGNGLWSFPASYPGVISVAAVDENKEKAPFSQFNRQVDVAAPGM